MAVLYSIRLTRKEWETIVSLIGDNPNWIGVTGVDPEPYDCAEKLIKAVKSIGPAPGAGPTATRVADWTIMSLANKAYDNIYGYGPRLSRRERKFLIQRLNAASVKMDRGATFAEAYLKPGESLSSERFDSPRDFCLEIKDLIDLS
tara:strand:- start:1946 stop:2383 length:438 start_codon:yes stop_codon:yes gene_type:complete